MKINNIDRPTNEIIEKLKKIGTATASGELNKLGIKVSIGHNKKNLKKATLVVISSAIKEK